MQETTASTEAFKAAGGMTVRECPDGSLKIGNVDGYLSRAAAFAAEEYYQAKRDRDLGRWRCSTDPDWVAIEGQRSAEGLRTVQLFNEGTFEGFHLNDRVLLPPRPGSRESESRRVARAFFDAHPEPPKAWHEASHGEVWAVTDSNGEALYRVTRSARFEQVSGSDGLLSMPITHWSITAARRVWPEDAS